MNITKILFVLLTAVFLSLKSTAQIPGLTQFTINHGLPSNTVYDIDQDDKGYIWIATDYGISKFDGKTFKNFTVKDGLPDNEILYLYKDSKNRIWLVGFNGKIGFYKNNLFYNESNCEFIKKIQYERFVQDIYEDHKGNIWFAGSNQIVKYIDPKDHYHELKINIPYSHINSKIFIEDKNKALHILSFEKQGEKLTNLVTTLLGSNNSRSNEIDLDLLDSKTINRIRSLSGRGLINYDTITKNISQIIYNLNAISIGDHKYKTYRFDDKYWITGLNKGAFIIQPEKDGLKPIRILNSYQTTKAYKDNEGNIWIGSQSNGLTLFPNQNVFGIKYKDNSDNNLFTVNLLNDHLYIGNGTGKLSIVNKNTLKTVKTFKFNKSTVTNRIRKAILHRNEMYIVSDLNFNKINSDLSLNKISNIFDEDFYKLSLMNFKCIYLNNDYAYTANAGGVAKIDLQTKKITKLWNKRTTCVHQSNADSLWLGTTNGLYLYKNNENNTKFSLNNKFNNSTITDLKTYNNSLLIASNSYGLGILQNDNFKTINIKNGLLSNYINSIFVDKNNTIWLSTNFGLNAVKLNNLNELTSIKSYTISDGLYSNNVRQCYSTGKKVYITTSEGLNVIDLEKEQNIMNPPKIDINAIFVNNEIIDSLHNGTLHHTKNNLQFNFSGISFKSLGNITFKYKLSKHENNWIETKTNSIRYSSLPPNKYNFQVKSIAKNQAESPVVSIQFTILPPFYNTWWFYSLILLSVVSSTLILYKRWLIKNREKEEVKNQIDSLRYQALNAQMNPHFINNLLGCVHDLIDKNEKKKAIDSLDSFANLVNLVLKSTKSNLISLQKELYMLEHYIELQLVRFENNFEYCINSSNIPQEDLNKIHVPPMIIQPIVENSIIHGIRNLNKKGSVQIGFQFLNEDYLMCTIIDNGIGTSASQMNEKFQGSGISLKNINQRLNLINTTNSTENLLFISDIQDEFGNLAGTKVEIKIPLVYF